MRRILVIGILVFLLMMPLASRAEEGTEDVQEEQAPSEEERDTTWLFVVASAGVIAFGVGGYAVARRSH